MDRVLKGIITKEYALDKNIFPVKMDEKSITVQMEKYNISLIKEIKSMTRREVSVQLKSRENIIKNIESSYIDGEQQNIGDENIYDLIADNIIYDAVRLNASDIHLEPFEDYVRLRYRIDGELKYIEKYTNDSYIKISSIIKLKSGCDITEKRVPQDGRFTVVYDGRDIDLRLSTIPTYYGEKIELRILDRQNYIKSLEELGFLGKAADMIRDTISQKRGMLLVTGPTGSGKSTTVYSILNAIKEEDINITTIEDPVECRIEFINQIQVNSKANLGFDNGLRSILRQDPDVISVGEIRDIETAKIAIRAAMTGHFVISTLHTEDAISTVSRLKDMGIESYQINSAISAIISQRLVKVKKIYPNTESRQRCLIYELLKFDDELREAIDRDLDMDRIKSAIAKSNMVTYEDSIDIQAKKYMKG